MRLCENGRCRSLQGVACTTHSTGHSEMSKRVTGTIVACLSDLLKAGNWEKAGLPDAAAAPPTPEVPCAQPVGPARPSPQRELTHLTVKAYARERAAPAHKKRDGRDFPLALPVSMCMVGRAVCECGEQHGRYSRERNSRGHRGERYCICHLHTSK